MNATAGKQFLSAKDIGAMLGVEPRSVLRWAALRIDDFPAPAISRPRCKRWRRSVIEDWVREQERRR